MKRSHRFLRTLALSFLLLLAAGTLLEQLARIRAARRFPLTGRLVRVGDHRLHLSAQGTGTPVVVFESGLDTGGSLPWAPVQRQVARFSCAVAYDRAGTLGSDRGTGPKTGATMALELHALLHQAGYPGPYILVGHSLGGVILRFFVRQYPHEVRGVVFVDASHPDQLQRFPPEPPAAFPAPAPWLVGLAGTTGLLRLINYVAYEDDLYPGTQARDSLNLVNNAFLPVSLAATLEEQQQIPALLREAQQLPSFGDIPLLVISGTSPTRYAEMGPQAAQIWPQLQQELLQLSTHSQQILAPKSGHYVQVQQPEIVTAAIKQLVDQANAAR